MSLSYEGSPPNKVNEGQFHFGRLMRQINHKITAGQDFKSIFEFLFESLDPIIPYDRIGIALIEGSGEMAELHCKWMKSKMQSGHLGVGFRGPLHGSRLQDIIQVGRPRIINDLSQYSLEKPESVSAKLALKDGIRSSLTCPIFSDKGPMGVVFFSSSKPNTYKAEHIDIYLEIADELSFVINQDRIRSEAKHIKSSGQNVRMLLHDLKAPLGIIQGFLEIAQDESWYDTLDGDAKNIFSTLVRNASHMHILLNELAELNQLNFEGANVNISQVSLRDFITELNTVGKELASKKLIRFELNCEIELPANAEFDPLKIRRAINNLLSNAVKYSPRFSNVNLAVSYRQNQLHFEVSDNGQGIPESELPKLFKEFGKTSVLPTEGESSSGIGLAIVKKIVEQHGGEVAVRSQVGIGSTFSFWIPLGLKT